MGLENIKINDDSLNFFQKSTDISFEQQNFL